MTEHRPIISPRRPRGSNRNGTALACTCGEQFGVVTNEAPSGGGRKIAQERHARHVAELGPIGR